MILPPIMAVALKVNGWMPATATRRHQQWAVERVDAAREPRDAGAPDAQPRFRIRSVADPQLCVTVPPVHYRMRDPAQPA